MATKTHARAYNDTVTNSLIGLSRSLKRKNDFSHGFKDALEDIAVAYAEEASKQKRATFWKRVSESHDTKMRKAVPVAEKILEEYKAKESDDSPRYADGYMNALSHVILTYGVLNQASGL